MLNDPVLLQIWGTIIVGGGLFLAIWFLLTKDQRSREKQAERDWRAVGYEDGIREVPRGCAPRQPMQMNGDKINREYIKGYNEGIEAARERMN